MKDLDFDEIDRAVSSAMGGSTTTDTPASDNNVTVASKSVNPQPTPSVPKTPQPSRGQFMDVVHPSSDMKKPHLVVPERPTRNHEVKEDRQASQASAQNIPEDVKSDDGDDDIAKLGADIEQELNDGGSELPDTPFISGTPVEKRPLGAFSDDSENETDDKTEEKSVDDTPSSLPPDEVPLPEELSDDLLKIESGKAVNTDMPSIDEQIASSEENSSESPQILDEQKEQGSLDPKPAETVTSQESPSGETVESPTAEKTDAEENQHPIPPVSIAGQFKEQPETQGIETGTIYDTDSYHKVPKPPKKKSGWLWVLWIVLLIVVGAGAGAAVYFFILAPNL